LWFRNDSLRESIFPQTPKTASTIYWRTLLFRDLSMILKERNEIYLKWAVLCLVVIETFYLSMILKKEDTVDVEGGYIR